MWYFDLAYFFKFMINREKHIPHVFSCQSHILTHQMGIPKSGYSSLAGNVTTYPFKSRLRRRIKFLRFWKIEFQISHGGFWGFSKFSESWKLGFEIFQISLKVENRVLRFSFFFAPAARNLMNFRGKSSNFSKNTSKFSPAPLKSMNLGSFLKIFARFAQ